MSPPSVQLIKLHALQLLESLSPRIGSYQAKLFNGDKAAQLNHVAYCEYFGRQWCPTAEHAGGRYVATPTLEDLAHLLQNVRGGESREELMIALKATGRTEEACRISIDLAARALLMMRFGVVKHEACPRGYLMWDSGPLGDQP